MTSKDYRQVQLLCAQLEWPPINRHNKTIVLLLKSDINKC